MILYDIIGCFASLTTKSTKLSKREIRVMMRGKSMIDG